MERIAAIALLLAHIAHGAMSDDIVGARLVVCQQCRLQQLPEVVRFINDVAPQYASLTVVDKTSAEPTVEFLNIYRQTVASVNVAAMLSDDIVSNLMEHGIFMWTPSPSWRPLPIEPTEGCVAWRQTGGCVASGPREPLLDERCTIRIYHDRSGYCECDALRRVRLDCGHDEGSCDQYCAYHAAK